jgi:hypothetical protein
MKFFFHFLLTAAVSLAACSDAKKEKDEKNLDAREGAKGERGERGQQGPKGDPGSDGEDGASGGGFACFDGNGDKIGYPLPGSSCSYFIVFNEGIVLGVHTDSVGLEDGLLPYVQCSFEESGCAGDCVLVMTNNLPIHPTKIVGRYESTYYKASEGAKGEPSVTIASRSSFDPFAGAWQCTDLASPETFTSATSAIYKTDFYTIKQPLPLVTPVYGEFE